MPDAAADAARCPSRPLRHDAILGFLTLLTCIGFGIYFIACRHAIALGKEVVAISATATVGERFTATGLGIVSVALIVATTRTRLWFLHTNIFCHLKVDVTIQWELAFPLLMQFQTLLTVRHFGSILQQYETLAYGNTASTRSSTGTPVTPLGGRAIGIGQLYLLELALRSHALVFLHNCDMWTALATLRIDKGSCTHRDTYATACRTLRPNAPGCSLADTYAFVIIVDRGL